MICPSQLYPLADSTKVCLSLLGTWSGEPWIPEKSTILQVLISIQGMILCEMPWYNEPGYESRMNTAAAIAYNEGLHPHTANFAMIQWLETPPSLWKDVVHRHFAQNGSAALAAIKTWAAMSTVKPHPTLP